MYKADEMIQKRGKLNANKKKKDTKQEMIVVFENQLCTPKVL
jgi:hypothetical protein